MSGDAGRLSVRNLSKRFGGLRAVDDCSFDVEPGTVVGLVGPNGSGKSTVFNMITNQLRADSGEVFYGDRKLGGLRAHQIARLGVGRTFQEVKIFRELTVRGNLGIAALGRRLSRWETRGDEVLVAMGLDHLADAQAETLSVGQQRLLELGMQLLVRPPLLLLDEPLAGVNPLVRARIGDIIRAGRSEGRAMLLIEHDMRFVMDLCDRVVVLDHGETIASGTPADVSANPAVITALLGSSRRKHAA